MGTYWTVEYQVRQSSAHLSFSSPLESCLLSSSLLLSGRLSLLTRKLQRLLLRLLARSRLCLLESSNPLPRSRAFLANDTKQNAASD
jgi:hypothetical protein